MERHKRIVVKLGTSVLMAKGSVLDPWTFGQIAGQVAVLKRSGIETVIVSSGAIQAGREAMTRYGLGHGLEKKILAGIGSRHLINEWGRVFSRRHIEVAQILVTYANWECEKERESVRSAISEYLKLGIVPIINENDVVSQNEIGLMERGISENDRLARMVASLVEADGVLFLTETDGVLDGDPSDNGSKRIERIGCNDTFKSFGNSSVGSGGMTVKVEEAALCRKEGARMVSIARLEKDTIVKFANGKPVGTRIDP